MKTLDYKEIYYASTEHSILTSYSGFGIRTYTNGMDSSDVYNIYDKCVFGFGYSVDSNRILIFEQIQQNPKIVYDYPPAYIFNKVTLDNGSIKYVFGRTIYIGIDYGYFCNNNNAMRVGSNYFSHLLIFDEMPPISIWAELQNESVFAPKDYTCTPDNEELKLLFTGNPQLLPAKSLQCNITSNDFCINIEFAYCIIGFLQSYYNTKNNKEDSLKKIIIKAPASKTPDIIKQMSLLPQVLMEEKTFLSNYMKGYGVPDDFNMVFVNEYNTTELYENNHICIDTFNLSTTNVDDNYFYKKIIELSEENDSTTILELVNYYLGLDLTKDLNYNFLYNLFIAIESDKDISLKDISKDFIDLLNNASLSSNQENKLWIKINNAINEGLTSKKGSGIKNALTVMEYFLPINQSKLIIAPESSNWITNVLFGENSYFSRLVDTSNLDNIIFILDRTKILSDNAFYNALKQSQESFIWHKFIQFYYENNLNSNIDYIIENILTSDIPNPQKEDLIKKLFPIKEYKDELLSYILNHTQHIYALIEIVKTICLDSTEERFSLILSRCNNSPEIIKVLSPIVLSYYERQIDNDINSGIKNLISFIEKVSVDVFNKMEVTRLFDKYINICMDNPSKETKDIINSLMSLNIIIDKNTSKQIEILNNLYENKIPISVDVNILFTAHKMDKSADYIGDLYEAWLKTLPTPKVLKEYIIKSADYLSSDTIRKIILATWNSSMSCESREDYVLIISDYSNWNSQDKKLFIQSCNDKELVSHLTNSEKLIKKIKRKYLNLFK